ncbi:DUF1876 domain-containing protein [Streptosporangium sandarakinum]|uniref:DUF1876 domain-containing protein n=1 Tax=Streptosporangium sandarakinum TaxID=1260955 RepID=A0A852UWL9_9ACTN|nr:DUF1876 domain-containing protein [Streptosporangium sandarakinum]NYF38025.1 hypothetical protein [Streptosporangium sandarakinum]
MEAKQWNVQISISEDDNDDVTTARAVLFTDRGKRHEGVAHARRNPVDQPVPDIGDELAAGRALSTLAAQLIQDGAQDVAQTAGSAREYGG